jgi:hypothetical protein
MIVRHFSHRLGFSSPLSVAIVVIGCILTNSPARAQFATPLFRGVVGGVSIDADGVVQAATEQDRTGVLKELRNQVIQPQGPIAEAVKLRMVSLSKLQAEIARAVAAGETLSDEVRYLAGLQRVEYLFVYPDRQDIVLAGPAEGWKIRDDATVVGITTGRPVLQLEDLLTALRSVKASQQQAITVSIDPTPEGEVALRKVLSQFRTDVGFDPASVEPAMKQAFGPQVVTLTTVPNTTRMAQTLVAADFRMKSLAMNLETSPIAGLPSYMEMIRDNPTLGGTQPRWWMACEYDALLHSEDAMAWQLTGQGVKALTEEEFVDVKGTRTSAGKKNKLAQKWADQFTQKFDELCTHNSAFGDLRNVMDLNVIATLIAAHQMEQKAGVDLSLLSESSGQLQTPVWHTPKLIPPQCSFVKGRAGWKVSASGGVEINPWRVVSEQTKPSQTVALVREKAGQSNHWWWN